MSYTQYNTNLQSATAKLASIVCPLTEQTKAHSSMQSFSFACLEFDTRKKTSQELRMLSSVTLNCQVTKIVMISGSQLS